MDGVLTEIARWVFWGSVLLVVYPYIGYPTVLWIAARFAARRGRPVGGGTPAVTLLISVYNEADVMDEKLQNTLALDYPADRLEIAVVSDGSTDDTHAIASRYAHRGVQLWVYSGRIGKSACLNHAVARARGEVVVFSDANSRYHPRAVRELVAPFADPTVGFVTGRTAYRSRPGERLSGSIGAYAKLETVIKRLESRVGSCVGADGAIFAIRRSLFRPLQATDINDLVTPLDIVEQGFRGELNEEAWCSEETAGGDGQEFRRQVRITNRTIRALARRSRLLNPFRYGVFSLQVASHKWARLVVPFGLLGALSASGFLALEQGGYAVLFGAQAAMYGAALLVSRFVIEGGWAAVFRGVSAFLVVNCAILYGWGAYMRGETHVVWAPTPR